jgi:hypothetical protein
MSVDGEGAAMTVDGEGAVVTKKAKTPVTRHLMASISYSLSKKPCMITMLPQHMNEKMAALAEMKEKLAVAKLQKLQCSKKVDESMLHLTCRSHQLNSECSN